MQIKKEDGKYTDVDITWNSRLKPYGFKTFQKDWDGKSRFIGINNIIQRYDGVTDANMKKKELTNSLEPELKERRERFLKEFIEWVDLINKA